MTTTVSNGSNGNVSNLLKNKAKPPALKKLASWKDETEFDGTGNPKTPRTSTTPGTIDSNCLEID